MEEFFIEYENEKIHAKFEHDNHKKQDLVIVVHGLTGSMEEAQLIAVCDAAKKANMAALRVELFGHGMSSGDFYNHDIVKWQKQLEYVISYMSGREDIGEIYLSGHSQGGLVALMAASSMEDKLKALILLAPAVCIVKDSKKGRFFDTSFELDDIPDEVSFWDEFTVGSNYIKVAQEINLDSMIKGFNKPVIIIHGTGDESVPFEDSVELSGAYKDVRLVDIKNATHCFDDDCDKLGDEVFLFLEEER